MTNKKTFMRITNQDIYEEIQSIRKISNDKDNHIMEIVSELKTLILQQENRIKSLESFLKYFKTITITLVGGLGGLITWILNKK